MAMHDLQRRIERLESARPLIQPHIVTGYIEPGESLPDAFARLRAGDPETSVLVLTPKRGAAHEAAPVLA